MVSVYVMCVLVMECTVQYREMCYTISICNVCVKVMECTVLYREMCYGISIFNVCNGDGVYGTV